MKQGFGFGERLRLARKAKGWSQEKLGEGLGEGGANVSKQTVVGWEKERHYPKTDQLREMCERLGVGADHLLFGAPEHVSPRVQQAAVVLAELSEEERLQLFTVINGPAYDDALVEQLAPITASLKKQESTK